MKSLKSNFEKKPVRQPFETDQLALTKTKFKLSGTFQLQFNSTILPWNAECSWDEIFYHIGPDLFRWIHENTVNRSLATAILKKLGRDTFSATIDDESFKTVKIQLMALGWTDVRPLNTKSGIVSLFWTLTPEGKQALMQLRTIKK